MCIRDSSNPRPPWEDNEEIDLGEPEDYVDSESASSDSEANPPEPDLANQGEAAPYNPNLTLEHPDPEEIIQDLEDTQDPPDLPDTDDGDFDDSFHSVPDSPNQAQVARNTTPEARIEPQASGSAKPATRAHLKKTGVTVPEPPYLHSTVEKAARLKLKQQLDEEEAAHRTRLAVIEKHRQSQIVKKKKPPKP